MATVFGGFTGLPAGMDAYRNPALLPDAQAARAVNVSFRGSLARTRPGLYEELMLPEGEFQGAGVWSLADPYGDHIVYVASGVVYVLELGSLTLWDMGDQMDHTNQCFFSQADQYLIIQDGLSKPFILEHDGSSYAQKVPDTSSPVPTGTIATYAHGRLHMVPTNVPGQTVKGDTYLLSGDICEPWNPETVLRFTETQYLNEGGAHSLPAALGPITALGALRNANTGTGIGTTVVFARRGVCAFDFSLPRETGWKSQALSQVMFFEAGTESPWGVVNANNDIIYRAADGIRTLGYSVSQAGGGSGSLSNLAISKEVDTWLGTDGEYVTNASMALYDNRLLTTTVPNDNGWFKGIVSWDIAAGSYAGVGGGGAYDGLWTGDSFCQLVTAMRGRRPVTYVFTEGPCIMRLDESLTADSFIIRDRDADVVTEDATGTHVANAGAARTSYDILSRLETRSIDFASLNTIKRLEHVDVWLSGMVDDVDITVYFKPHLYPKWFQASSRTVYVPSGSMPQGRRRLRFALPEIPTTCNPATGESPHAAFSFQLAVRWEGHAVIEQVVAVADAQAEEPTEPCDDSTVDPILEAEVSQTGVVLDDYEYLVDRELSPPAYVLVTYDGNGEGRGGAGSQMKLAGTALTLRSDHGFVRTGYELTGWNTAADGSGTAYALGGSYETDEALTLYAVWTLRFPYTITYDENDADQGEIESQQKEHDVDIALRRRGTLYRGGFYFAGWNTHPDGIGTDYSEEEVYTGNADLVLYAKWTADPWYVTPDDFSVVFVDEAFPAYVTSSGEEGSSWATDVERWDDYMRDYSSDNILVFDMGDGWLYPASDDSPLPLDSSCFVELDKQLSAEDMEVAILAAMATKFGADILTTPYKIHFHVDSSGSMTRGTIGDALDSIESQLDDNSVENRETTHTNERWLRWVIPPVAPPPTLYPVTYDGNEEDSGSISTQYKEHWEPLVLSEGGGFEKSGYSVSGWNTAADGSGSAYDLGDTYLTNASLALYAQWTTSIGARLFFAPSDSIITSAEEFATWIATLSSSSTVFSPEVGDTAVLSVAPPADVTNLVIAYPSYLPALHDVLQAGTGTDNSISWTGNENSTTITHEGIEYRVYQNVTEFPWTQPETFTITL